MGYVLPITCCNRRPARWLDVLGDFVKKTAQEPWQHHVTAAVAEELAVKGQSAPDWATLVHGDGLNEIVAFGAWCQRLVGANPHDRGEASVAAWAESHNAIAIVDDKDARIVMQRNGVQAHGSMWILCQVINCGRINVQTAASSTQLSRQEHAYPSMPADSRTGREKQACCNDSCTPG